MENRSLLLVHINGRKFIQRRGEKALFLSELLTLARPLSILIPWKPLCINHLDLATISL